MGGGGQLPPPPPWCRHGMYSNNKIILNDLMYFCLLKTFWYCPSSRGKRGGGGHKVIDYLLTNYVMLQASDYMVFSAPNLPPPPPQVKNPGATIVLKGSLPFNVLWYLHVILRHWKVLVNLTPEKKEKIVKFDHHNYIACLSINQFKRQSIFIHFSAEILLLHMYSSTTG